MSEPIPESIPTSADPRSRRPLKKARPNTATPISAQGDAISALFEKQPEIDLRPSSALIRPLAAPPEIVANVQGSSAGAGSGEFHVYKASRRREYERVRMMEEESKKEEADREWEAKQEERKTKDEARMNKNQKKREKAKAKKSGKLVTIPEVKRLGALDVKNHRRLDAGEEEEGDDQAPGTAVEEKGITIQDDD